MEIRYIKRPDINTTKWDSCISRSVNGIIYAYSWYLDIVAENWDALIADDYSAVFPLVYGKKYGFDFLYQPSFTNQLGLFSIGAISSEFVNGFIEAIPDKFRYINISLNTFIKPNNQEITTIPKTTYHLDLIEPYPVISGRYSLNVKKNISIALANQITVIKGLSAFQILELKKNNLTQPLKQKHFELLRRIITAAVYNGSGELYGAYTNYNELCAAIFILSSNSKSIYLLGAASEEGRTKRAMYTLIDHYIQQHSEKGLVLDFEGSSNEEVKKFYLGFGAQECSFSQLVLNRLPWYLKIFR